MEMFESQDLPGGKPTGVLALLGAWDDVDDDVIDEFIDDVYRSRAEDLGRNVRLEP